MRQWFRIYNNQYLLQGLLPVVVLRPDRPGRPAPDRARAAAAASRTWRRRCRQLAPRPLLMIHGGGDTYIKPEMAQALFDCAGEPKEFWLVEGAKHNQALHVAGDEYRRRVLEFFERHLAGQATAPAPAAADGAASRTPCRSGSRDRAGRHAARSSRAFALRDRHRPETPHAELRCGTASDRVLRFLLRTWSASSSPCRSAAGWPRSRPPRTTRARCRKPCCARILAHQADTDFGRDHHFAAIRTVADFRRQLPVAGYEYFEPYIARVRQRRDQRPARPTRASTCSP